MELETLVEVTAGNYVHRGKEGVVKAIEGRIATVQPVDAELREVGECFEVNAGALTEQPSPREILLASIKFRAAHHAKLRRPAHMRLPEVRTYHPPSRRRRKGSDY